MTPMMMSIGSAIMVISSETTGAMSVTAIRGTLRGLQADHGDAGWAVSVNNRQPQLCVAA
jgi:hypothetical protein